MTEPSDRPALTHVIAGFDTGGTETMTLRLVHHWCGAFEQRVVALGDDSGALRDAFEAALPGGVVALGLRRFGGLGAMQAMTTTLRRQTPDALLVNCFGRHHLVAALAARRAGVRAVGAWAGNPPPQDPAALRSWAAVLSGSRQLGCPVAACSESVMAALKGVGPRLPRGSCVIPNGIDVGEIAARATIGRKGRRGDSPVVGMVARLDAIKDHLTLIRAFAIFRPAAPTATLWIVGDGPLRPALEAEAGRLGVAEATRFLGRRTDVPELLGQMDLYAFSTTRDEGFGIALIEAMAAGVPIVATDVPACREVLDGGAAGLLAPPADPVALAAGLLRLIDPPGEAARFAEAATHRARTEYAVAACARRWEAVLGLKTDGKNRASGDATGRFA